MSGDQVTLQLARAEFDGLVGLLEDLCIDSSLTPSKIPADADPVVLHMERSEFQELMELLDTIELATEALKNLSKTLRGVSAALALGLLVGIS